MNRRKTASLLLSIAIHAIIIATVWYFMQERKLKMQTASTAKRVELSLQDFITAPSLKKPVKKAQPAPKKATQPLKNQMPDKKKSVSQKRKPVPAEKKRPTPKKEVKKETEKEPVKKAQKKSPPSTDKKTSATVPTGKQPSTGEKREEAKRVKEPPAPKESKPSSALSRLAGALGTPSVPTPPSPSIDEISDAVSNEEFKALYKDEFDRFTPEQKRFIKNNLSRIQGITQHYLTVRGYPYIAARLNQDGMNIVEFYLHPNGDITDLKVIQGSGVEVLDQNSLDTIKTAYKDYPHPTETTKIRFYIYYRLY